MSDPADNDECEDAAVFVCCPGLLAGITDIGLFCTVSRLWMNSKDDPGCIDP